MSTSKQQNSNPAARPHMQNQPSKGRLSDADLRAAIGRRAKEIYENSGRVPGRDLENWAQAEADIHTGTAAHLARKPAVVVKVEGVQYVGEYDSVLAFGYKPGEFVAGDPVRVRFDAGKMYVVRPNGQNLETTIIARIG